MKRMLMTIGAAGMMILGASAADYHWTGAAGDHLWSSAGNWNDSTGNPAAAAPTPGTAYTYNFGQQKAGGPKISWGDGLVVTQDMAVVIGSALAFNPPTTAGESITFVTANGGSMKFGGESGIYLQDNSRLTLNVDLSGDDKENNLVKYGTGTLVFALKKPNARRRTVVVINGKVEVAENDAGANIAIGMAFSPDESATPAFSNRRNGADIHGLYATEVGNSRANGRADLHGTTLNVGGESASTSTNNLPGAVFAEGGTLAYRNERRVYLRGLPIGGTLAVDHADVRVDAAGTAIRWLFDDEDDPMRDDVGAGARLLAPNGVPEVVTDAVRGKVLSISGGKYFKGPDANAGFAELQQQTTNNAYTVAFWFKPDASCDNLGKIFYWGGNQEAYKAAGLRLNNDSSKGLMFTVWGNNRTLTTGNMRDGNWHHFAVTYNGNKTFRVYVDNTLVDSFSQDSYFPPNKNFYIGAIYGGWVNNGANPYAGLLDDFLIGSYEMTAGDISALYDNGLKATVGVGSVEARSPGEVAFAKSGVTVKTLSGCALAGGVTMLEDGSTLTVGAEAGTAASTFKGRIGGGDTTLVKEGADYALTLSGPAAAVTNVVVKEGTLELRRPTARMGLVAYYGFDDTAIGADSSPAGFALSKTGGGTISQIEGGVSGKALNFGGSAYLKSTDYLHSTFPTGNDSYTVSMWIKPTAEAYSNNRPLYCWGRDGTNTKTSFMRLNGGNSGGGVMFTHWGDNFVAAAGNLADGNWHHVVAVYDGTARKKTVYVDGTAYAAAANQAVAVDGETSLYIGSRSGSTSTTYAGGMDEFMVIAGAWTAGEVTNEYARKAPALVAAETLLPAPVAHWTFDDDAAPGADSSANALSLTTSGAVTLEAGGAICGKAARFSSSSGYFKLDSFPSAIPTSSNAFTVVVRYRPDKTQSNAYYPGIVMWGDPNGWNSGKLVKISTEHGALHSIRSTVAGSIFMPAGFYRTDMGTERSRWVTTAFTYSPNKYTSKLYADGEYVSQEENSPSDISAQDFSIGSNYAGKQNFYGLIDDVRIYDKTLSAAQIRLIAEQLEAVKGTSDAADATSAVLSREPSVDVAAGATLSVSSVEAISSLSGAGTVDVAALGSLAVAKLDGFSGTVTGTGVLGIADDAVIEFGDGSTPVVDAAGTVSLGSNVTVNATFADGRCDLLRAASFVGLENLATWRVVLPGGREASLGVSKDGYSIVVKTLRGCVIFIR